MNKSNVLDFFGAITILDCKLIRKCLILKVELYKAETDKEILFYVGPQCFMLDTVIQSTK